MTQALEFQKELETNISNHSKTFDKHCFHLETNYCRTKQALNDFLTSLNSALPKNSGHCLEFGQAVQVLNSYTRFPKWTPRGFFDVLRNIHRTLEKDENKAEFEPDFKNVVFGRLDSPQVCDILYAFCRNDEKQDIVSYEKSFLDGHNSARDNTLHELFSDKEEAALLIKEDEEFDRLFKAFDYNVLENTYVLLLERGALKFPSLEEKEYSDYDDEEYSEYNIVFIDLRFIEANPVLKESLDNFENCAKLFKDSYLITNSLAEILKSMLKIQAVLKN